jgi:hypothetical protein
MRLQIFQDSKGRGQCRSCGAPLEWAELTSGKRHPFNPPIVVTATVGSLLDGARIIELVDTAITSSHFATCPQAAEHRRK